MDLKKHCSLQNCARIAIYFSFKALDEQKSAQLRPKGCRPPKINFRPPIRGTQGMKILTLWPLYCIPHLHRIIFSYMIGIRIGHIWCLLGKIYSASFNTLNGLSFVSSFNLYIKQIRLHILFPNKHHVAYVYSFFGLASLVSIRWPLLTLPEIYSIV